MGQTLGRENQSAERQQSPSHIYKQKSSRNIGGKQKLSGRGQSYEPPSGTKSKIASILAIGKNDLKLNNLDKNLASKTFAVPPT